MRSTEFRANDQERFDSALTHALGRLGVEVDAARRRLMFRHYQLVIEANRQFNLTRITSPEDAAVKHYADSLTVLTIPDVEQRPTCAALDIGTGAGFPAIPLAIVRPQWSVVAIDGTGKKARFVAESAAALGLENLKALHQRAETIGREAAAKFDLVLMRAVAHSPKGIDVAARHVARGGRLVLYKTAHLAEQELAEARRAAQRQGLRAREPVEIILTGGHESYRRQLLVFDRPE